MNEPTGRSVISAVFLTALMSSSPVPLMTEVFRGAWATDRGPHPGLHAWHVEDLGKRPSPCRAGSPGCVVDTWPWR